MIEKTDKIRCLVIGGTGMLGHKLVQTLSQVIEVWTIVRRPFFQVKQFGFFNRLTTFDALDVQDTDALREAIEKIRPSVIINAVGVIKQDATASDPTEMIALNTLLPQYLASLSIELDFRFISISTDCVFSGKKGNYREGDPSDVTDIYGESKYMGEVAIANCLTLRTSMIGRELDTCHSLVEWLLSNRGGEVKGFVNAIFSGLSTIRLARVITSIIRDQPTLSGLYHISSEPISKFDLLTMINGYFDAGIRIIPDESVRIDRSLNSDRFRDRTGFEPVSWEEMIHEMALDPTPYERFHEVN